MDRVAADIGRPATIGGDGGEAGLVGAVAAEHAALDEVAEGEGGEAGGVKPVARLAGQAIGRGSGEGVVVAELSGQGLDGEHVAGGEEAVANGEQPEEIADRAEMLGCKRDDGLAWQGGTGERAIDGDAGLDRGAGGEGEIGGGGGQGGRFEAGFEAGIAEKGDLAELALLQEGLLGGPGRVAALHVSHRIGGGVDPHQGDDPDHGRGGDDEVAGEGRRVRLRVHYG